MNRFRYTIVELLTVVAIASILLSIAIPAFSRMMRGQASTLAAREIMGRIHAARSYALAKRTPVAFVFCGSEVPLTVETRLDNYVFSAYRVCNVKYDDENRVWVFQSWISEWYFLPKGVAVGLTESPSAGAIPTDAWSLNNQDERAIRTADVSHDNDDVNATDYNEANQFYVNQDSTNSYQRYGNSQVYFCDVSDLYPNISREDAFVTFNNAFIINQNGNLEKPQNFSDNENAGNTILPDVPLILPLRDATIDGGQIIPLHENDKNYIPIRIEPSGKTKFFDGYITYP